MNDFTDRTEAIRQSLIDRAEDLFEMAFGPPQRRGGARWRPRDTDRDAYSVAMQGPERGVWTDHRSGDSGGIFDLAAIALCGMDSAEGRFLEVRKRAAAYCGLAEGVPIDHDAIRKAKEARAKKAAAEEAAEAKRRASTVATVRSAAHQVQGSPAAAYLAGRMVTDLPRVGLAYVAPLPPFTKGIRSPEYAALIAWAYDDAGSICGGQRILLTPDGTRPDIDLSKLTFGSFSGFPARFPARAEGGTLCVAEGPESALSVWMATGCETWAVFGVEGWETAPLPTGRKIILCPDKDAPDSKAGKAFAKAVAAHIAAGLDIWIAEAPKEEGLKQDLNDTHQRAGIGAVKAAIRAAYSALPTPTDPRPDAGPQRSGGHLSLPPAAPLPDGRRETLASALADAGRETILPIAVAVAKQMQLSAPLVYGAAEIEAFILDAAPDGYLGQDQLAALRSLIEWIQDQRRGEALSRAKVPESRLSGHEVIRVDALDQIDAGALGGVVIVSAPMGTGKTQKIGRPFIEAAQEQGETCMAIAHRVTLIAELSKRLSLPNYQAVRSGEIQSAGGVAVCLPSTARHDIKEALPAPRRVFIDEISQVLQFLSEPMCSAGEAGPRAVYARLEQIVRDAEAVIVADADIDERTLHFLEKCRPNERFKVVIMRPRPTDKQATVYPSGDPILEAISVELTAGGKVWLSCESEKKARAIEKLFQEDGRRIICITASTKEGDAQRAFLIDAEAESLGYDLVISSPAISSGISIEHSGAEHFTLGAYVGTGGATRPEDAKQQLGRVRYLRRYVIGLERSNLTGGQSVAASRLGVEGAAEIEGLGIGWTDFDSFAAGVKTDAKNARADFAAGLWWHLEAEGWALNRPGEDDVFAPARGLMRAATKAEKEAQHAALLIAEPMDTHLAGLAAKSKDLPQMQRIRYEAHRIRLAVAKLTLTPSDLSFWDDGRGLSRLARYEALIGAEKPEPYSDAPLSLRAFPVAQRALYRVLFDGINPFGDISAADAETILDRIMTRPHLFAAVGIVGDKYRAQFRGAKAEIGKVRRPKQAGREVCEILKRCGLKCGKVRVRSVPKRSLIYTKRDSFGTNETRSYSYRVTLESVRYMADLIARRQGFDIDAAIHGIAPDPSPAQEPESPTEARDAPFHDPAPAEVVRLQSGQERRRHAPSIAERRKTTGTGPP